MTAVLCELAIFVNYLVYKFVKTGPASLYYDLHHVMAQEARMAVTPWYERILKGTRGQLIKLLRREPRTVDELAQALGLTDNAVRAHLAALERDGLVRQHGVRRGAIGKPAYAYELTADAEALGAQAYGPVLDNMLDLLAERMSPQEIIALFQDLGRRLAPTLPAKDTLQARLAAAVNALNDLGGLAEVEKHDDSYAIDCFTCPLAVVVPRHPEACQFGEALLTVVVGRPVHARCARGTPPRCHFEVQTSQ
jgi:predicted ArsR family transcriptional regulator